MWLTACGLAWNSAQLAGRSRLILEIQEVSRLIMGWAPPHPWMLCWISLSCFYSCIHPPPSLPLLLLTCFFSVCVCLAFFQLHALNPRFLSFFSLWVLFMSYIFCFSGSEVTFLFPAVITSGSSPCTHVRSIVFSPHSWQLPSHVPPSSHHRQPLSEALVWLFQAC